MSKQGVSVFRFSAKGRSECKSKCKSKGYQTHPLPHSLTHENHSTGVAGAAHDGVC